MRQKLLKQRYAKSLEIIYYTLRKYFFVFIYREIVGVCVWNYDFWKKFSNCSCKTKTEKTGQNEEFTPFFSSLSVRSIIPHDLTRCYHLSPSILSSITHMKGRIVRLYRSEDLKKGIPVLWYKESKWKLLQQPSRDEPEDAPSFAWRLKNGAWPLPDPLPRRLKYPPIQD